MAATVTISILIDEINVEKLPVQALKNILSQRGIVANRKDKKREVLSTVRTVVLKEELVKVRGIEVLRILSILSHTHRMVLRTMTRNYWNLL